MKKTGRSFLPVEIVNITEECKQDKFCRLFQVPDNWNEEILKENDFKFYKDIKAKHCWQLYSTAKQVRNEMVHFKP